jgi:DNA-directed RNA polymerase specialized sigma subunit
MDSLKDTEMWLKTIFNINRELDFERESIRVSFERIEELERKKEEVYNTIHAIENPTCKQILFKRYVQGKKWEEIEQEMNYAPQHIHRLHKKAVEEAHKIKTEQK